MKTVTKRRVMTLFALGVLVALPAESFAGHWAWKFDGNDAEGEMDLKRVSVMVPGHTPEGTGRAKCRLDFIESPALKDIQGRCEFDTKGGEKKDILILSYWYQDKYWAVGSTWDGQYVTGSFPASWTRKNGDLILSFKEKYLKGRDGYMKWKVGAGDGADWAPSENGWFKFNWN